MNNKNVNFKDRTGEKHITNQGYEVEIIEYFNSLNCTILFSNGLICKNIIYRHIKNGYIKNPLHKTVYNIGYMGVGDYVTVINKKKTRVYLSWYSMMKRSYSEKYHKIYPTYKDVKVCEEWQNFQTFAKWFYENYNPEIMQGWHLDKDILIKDNRIYSPDTCIFVPNEINCVFTSRVNMKNKILALDKYKELFSVSVYENLLSVIKQID